MAARHVKRGQRRTLAWIAGGVVVAAAGFAAALLVPPPFQSDTAAPTPTSSVATSSTPTPTPPPLTPAERLLAEANDPTLCAMTFDAVPTPIDPVLVTADHRLLSVPIPTSPGQAFAGWYPSPEAAAAQDPLQRINEADMATCNEHRQINLTAAWVSAETAAASPVEVPILMYHQFTQKPEGEDSWLRSNYVYVPTFAEHMQYLKDQGYYLPSWPELQAFIAGTLVLPEKSVIITDDDADQTWIDWAVPIVTEKQLLTTSFVITSARQAPTPSEWVIQRSHTHDMHSAGANGKGKMVNLSVADMTADLATSAQILGATEVLCYPFGHYNEDSKQAVTAAGYALAVTVDGGFAKVGSDPLALPRQRVNFGMDLNTFIGLLGD